MSSSECIHFLAHFMLHITVVQVAYSQNILPIRSGEGVSVSSQHQFQSTTANILRSLSLGWQETAAYPKLVQSFLISSASMPTSSSFEKFVGSDVDYDPSKIIKFTEWVPRVPNSHRQNFETQITLPNNESFEIFSFDSSGKKNVEPPDSQPEYHPITYCSPRYDALVGFDLYNDQVEGPFLRMARDTGQPSSSPPFLLRGLSVPFAMGMTIYLPLYAINAPHDDPTQSAVSLSKTKTNQYWGCITVVIHFHSLLTGILQGHNLQSTDVFLFHAADDAYIAHFESDPPETKPNYTPATAAGLRPSDIAGDVVTTYGPHYDVAVANRTFRLLVRSRAGSNPRDVRVYSRRVAARSSVARASYFRIDFAFHGLVVKANRGASSGFERLARCIHTDIFSVMICISRPKFRANRGPCSGFPHFELHVPGPPAVYTPTLRCVASWF
jgi:hypothetical protein